MCLNTQNKCQSNQSLKRREFLENERGRIRAPSFLNCYLIKPFTGPELFFYIQRIINLNTA